MKFVDEIKSCVSFCLLWILIFTFPLCSYAKILNYHYIEAEKYQSSQGTQFVGEGVMYWMGHPSGGRTVFFDPKDKTGYTKYDISLLEDGEYYVFIRQLAWTAPQASVEVQVNSSSLGITQFAQSVDRSNTYLAWSNRFGPFSKVGKTEVTLKPVQGNIQWQYLDVLLVTNDPNFLPDNTDQDYESLNAEIHDDIFGFSNQTIHSFPDKTKVKLEVENPSKSVRSLTLWAGVVKKGTTKASAERLFEIKPGKNVLQFDFAVTGDKSRQVVTKILNDKKQVIYAAISGSTVSEAVSVQTNSLCLTDSDPNLQISLKINDPDFLASCKNLELSVGGIEKKVPVVSGQALAEISTKRLAEGKYTLTAKTGTITKVFPLTKWNVLPEQLEDIRQVTIKDNAIFVNDKPFVPRYLFMTECNVYVKTQGFNAAMCWAEPGESYEKIEKLLDQAHSNNLYGYALLYTGSFYKGEDKGYDLEELRRAVNKLKSHPALLCYYLFDEPDLRSPPVPVKYLMDAYNLIKSLDPNHPVILNFSSTEPALYPIYFGPADILSVDCYPVPAQPVTTVSDRLDDLARAANFQKPLMVVVQTYGGLASRMPTPEEVKCMTWLSINHGAKLLSWYSYWEGAGYPHCLHGDKLLWSYMRILNNELMLMKDFIVASPSTSKVSCSSQTIDFSLRDVNGKLYLAAVNKNDSRVKARFTIPKVNETKKQKAKVFFEDRDVSITKGMFEDTFKPYEVHMYLFQ